MENTITIPPSKVLSIVTLSLCAGLAGGVWGSAGFWSAAARLQPARTPQRCTYVPMQRARPPVVPTTPIVATVTQCPVDPQGPMSMIRWQNGRYEVSRELFDRALDSPLSHVQTARIVPSIVDGKPRGVKFYAIRPCSLFDRLGIRNGDLIQSINGMDLSTPDKALAVYTKLRTAEHYAVQIERRGVPMTLNYHLSQNRALSDRPL